MKIKIITAIILLINTISLFSQNISGNIYEINEKKEKNSLVGVNVFWIGTTIGTTTNTDGKFQISAKDIKDQRLIMKMLGFKTDTVVINGNTRISHQLLGENQQLSAVEISVRNDSYISKLNARKVEVITTGELFKAACCNLSESFETNASVDVSYSDAITGAKQIQMLGLSGVYSQIQTENFPSVRGMASTFGLNYIPGSWMESIQIAKGTSSVVNGYESITGQINVEYKKPANSDKLFVNIYANNKARFETNVVSAYKLNDKLSTMLMLHTDNFNQKIDNNNDNFMDLPKLNTINIFNRWDYMVPGKFTSRFGVKYMEEHRDGGTMDYDKSTFVDDTAKINKWTQPYGFNLTTRRGEIFWKNGIIFPSRPLTSLAIIVNATNHEQKGYFGINNYYGRERTLYANLLYSSIIGNKDHKFTTGLSYMLDNNVESYNQKLYVYNYQVFNNSDLFTVHHSVNNYYNLDREESIPGAYFEYTYSHNDKITVIAGIRADHHNKYGTFYTPRLNARYHIDALTVIRGSIGYGYRTANLISENLSLLASQRNFVFESDLKQEKALNFGINFSKEFALFGRKAEFNLDLYRTNFENQVIVDLDSVPTTAYFYNLKGESYANSYQAQLSMEPIKRLTLLVAYRINDVKTTIDNVLQQRPFVNKFKGLITLSYASRFDKWKFDLTTQFNGSARLSNQSKMPAKIKRDDTTPEYIIINAQVTRKFKYFDIYLGGENLGNFTQKDPITEAFAPYHSHFDTTMTWGPVSGTTIYAGLRYSIK